jgi:putative glutamine amidotransferase
LKKIAGVSKCDKKFELYTSWLKSEGIQYKVLDYSRNNFEDIKECSSLLLTGGDDIFPEFYNDWYEEEKRDQYVPERDGFEFKLLDYAILENIPVLGICRGMQLINCKLNGSLIKDIETERGLNHKKISDTEDREHGITVYPGSVLYKIVNCETGTVNSSHHQGIDRLGENLKVSAKSPDGIIEAVEWDEKSNKSFFLGIQWHPERMRDKDNIFTRKILERFKAETLKS